jgi:GTP cyclohydrolase IA
MDLEKIKQGFELMLEGMGENVQREGLLGTPDRVARMYQEMFTSLEQSPDSIMDTQFEEQADEMVILKDISFTSMCEHHFLPFIGKAHVAYIPGKKVVGLSKLARAVEYFAAKPQIQERMTREIAYFIQDKLCPKGVAVVLEASHSCMTVRGVKKSGATMITSQLLGLFKSNAVTRAEFSHAIQKG